VLKESKNTESDLIHQYVEAAFSSRAKSLAKSRQPAQRQEACMLQVIASHIKFADRSCFAKPAVVLAEFNAIAPNFGIKTIAISTANTIIKRLIDAGLLTRTHSHIKATNQRRRYLRINLDGLKSCFKAVYNLASSHAKALFRRGELAQDLQEPKAHPKASDSKASRQNQSSQNWRIKSEEKPIGFKTDIRLSPEKFCQKYFGSDWRLAYQLQDQAHKGAITANGARRLIALHNEYSVRLGNRERYLRYVIAEGESDPSGLSEKRFFESLNRMEAVKRQTPKAPKEPAAQAPSGTSSELQGFIASQVAELQALRSCMA
jgi:hypothetical protein